MSGPVYRVGDPAPPPLPLRSEPEVMARWQQGKPVVSIKCATYQHVGFIEDALLGFLGQDTDFPFEVLVRDDASTDGTAELVQDYASRYPNIIRAVFETKNGWPAADPYKALDPMVRGEFVALCEGDDYWIDSRHLQSRVDMLREDGDARSVVGDTIVVRDGTITGHEVIQRDGAWNWYLPTRSLVHCGDFTPGAYEWAQDMGLALVLQRAGGLRVLEGPPTAAYRLQPSGIVAGPQMADEWSGKENKPNLVRIYLQLALQLAREGDLELAQQYQSHAITKATYLLERYGIGPDDSPARGRRLRGLVRRLLG